MYKNERLQNVRNLVILTVHSILLKVTTEGGDAAWRMDGCVDRMVG
jgi:hypothetical protein